MDSSVRLALCTWAGHPGCSFDVPIGTAASRHTSGTGDCAHAYVRPILMTLPHSSRYERHFPALAEAEELPAIRKRYPYLFISQIQRLHAATAEADELSFYYVPGTLHVCLCVCVFAHGCGCAVYLSKKRQQSIKTKKSCHQK